METVNRIIGRIKEWIARQDRKNWSRTRPS